MHSTVLLESAVGHPWDQDNSPLDAGAVWGSSTQEAFVSFNTSAYASARFRSSKDTVWMRSVYAIHPNEAYPVIVIRDSFAGPDAVAGKIFSLNLMAAGEVNTPAGTISPPLRTYEHNNERPSAGKVFPLRPGLNQLKFTGQWGIDWDLYTVSSELQEANIGNWAHGWHPSREQSEFARANGRKFEERQHILRLRGNGPFKVLILPYRKGEKRDNLQVKQDGPNLVITSKDETTIVNDAFYAYQKAQKRVLVTFAEQRMEANGISATGGPVEVIVEPQRATITAHGKKGMRKLTLPGTWNITAPKSLSAPPVFKAGEWILDYQGESPATVILERQ
jgi:hypothetical protein